MPIAFCVGYASPDEPERSPSFRLPPEELFFQESLDHPMEGIQPLVTFPGKDDKRPQEEVPQEGEQEEEGTHWDRPPQEHIMT